MNIGPDSLFDQRVLRLIYRVSTGNSQRHISKILRREGEMEKKFLSNSYEKVRLKFERTQSFMIEVEQISKYEEKYGIHRVSKY